MRRNDERKAIRIESLYLSLIQIYNFETQKRMLCKHRCETPNGDKSKPEAN